MYLTMPVGKPGEAAKFVAPSRRRREVDDVCGMDYNLSEANKKLSMDAHNNMRRREGSSDMLKVVSLRLIYEMLLMFVGIWKYYHKHVHAFFRLTNL